MMVFAIVVVGIAVLVALYVYGSKLESKQYDKNEDENFTQFYKEDIDFSLMVKDYPVVNDEDIRYTEWLVKKASMK